MAVKSSLAHSLQKCIGNLWKGEDFSDVTIDIVVEDTSFFCHRFILSACSSFFQGLFRSQMKESLAGVTKLNRMTKETFEIIINSIYKGTDGLTEDNVLDVWIATHLLQIDYLIEECKQFVIDNLSVDNCFLFLNHAMTYSAQEVINSCLLFISKNFEHVRNVESFLQLPLDYFYKVIESDLLVTSSEDSVVDAILTWMEYTPDPEHISWLYTETLGDTSADEILRVADISTNSLTIKWGHENIDDGHSNQTIGQNNEKNDHQKGYNDQEKAVDDVVKGNIQHSTAFVKINDENSSNSECCEMRLEVKSHIMTSEGNTSMCNKDITRQSNTEERKQHFLKLISACRLFLAKPNCLEKLLKNHRDLIIRTGAFDLVLNALMYSLSVGLRHETWPEAAVHRASSSYKHVVVFLCNKEFKAYSLETGSVHEFAKVPDDYSSGNRIIVFDNGLYFVYQNTNRQTIFSIITKQKSWAPITGLNIYNPQMFLAHGNYVYNVDTFSTQFTLSRWSYAHDHSTWMTQTRAGYMRIYFIMRFKLYIVVFATENNVLYAHCFNTETDNVHVCTTSMDVISFNMTSFSSNGDVYVLQGTGRLWKVISTDTTPVDFVLVSKLWDLNYTIHSCVLYRKKLYIFCANKNPDVSLTSLPGICEEIVMTYIYCTSECLPMILPGPWLT